MIKCPVKQQIINAIILPNINIRFRHTMIHKNNGIIFIIIFSFLTFISCDQKSNIKTPPAQEQKQVALKHNKELEKVSELLRNGELTEADKLIKSIIKKDPDNYKAYFYRGVLNQKNVEFAESLEDYYKAAELNPGDALTYAYAGRLLIVMRGDLKEAKENFDKALNIDPNNREAQMGVGMMLMFTEDYGDAKIFFDKLIDSIPNINSVENADLFQERGFAHYYVKDFKKALEDFNKAIELDPDNLNMTTNYAGRAMTYYHLGELDKAVEDVYKIKNTQEIVTLHSEYDVIVQVIFYKGDLERAFQLCRLAYKAFPSLYADIRRYGEMLDNFGRTLEAHKMFEKAMEKEPHNIEAYERMGYSFMAMGQMEQAESMFKKAVTMAGDPKNKREAQRELADFLTAAGRYREAEEILNNVINSSDGDDTEELSAAYLGICRIKCFTGKFNEAEKYLNLSEKLTPDSLTKEIQKAEFLQKQGKYSEAAVILKKAVPIRYLKESDAYHIDMKLAEVLFAMGKRDEGFTYLKRVFEKDYPSAGLVRLRFTIPGSAIFIKLRKDPEINKFLAGQKEKIFDIYKQGGALPEKLSY
jgi:tetratricopeptide (TPR) repeat protein